MGLVFGASAGFTTGAAAAVPAVAGAPDAGAVAPCCAAPASGAVFASDFALAFAFGAGAGAVWPSADPVAKENAKVKEDERSVGGAQWVGATRGGFVSL